MRTYYYILLLALVTLFSCTSQRPFVADGTRSNDDFALLDSMLTYSDTDQAGTPTSHGKKNKGLRLSGKKKTAGADGGKYRLPIEADDEHDIGEVADATRVATVMPDEVEVFDGEDIDETIDRMIEQVEELAETDEAVEEHDADDDFGSLEEDFTEDADGADVAETEHPGSDLDDPLASAAEFAKAQRKDTTIAVHYDANEGKEKVDTVNTKSGIDSPVEYSATDSLVYDAISGSAYLYGSAKVKYQNMDLGAERIMMNMDSSLVHAAGVTDTLGVSSGTPVYKQGQEEYESETMAFNFKTKQGYITDVKTEQGDGYLYSAEAKRTADGMFNVANAKYTTCDADHPHFYLKLTKGKIRPGKETFFGPAYLVVEDVPLPLAVPYGFFPFSKSYSSGIIFPTYGDENARGFYLREGGYYLALSDKMDLKLLGEIYTKGSWGLSAETQYAKRYKFRGNAMISYQNTINGEKNLPDYQKQTSLKVTWTHSTDPKSNPNQSFSARVNFASQNYEKSNLTSMYNPTAYTQSTRASSVSYSRNISKIGMSLALSGNITQNMRDSSLTVTLPDLSINISRFYPFRRKHAAGKERWYEKISMSYTGQLSNSFSGKESQLLKANMAKDWRNGMQHRVPIDATFQLFKYINISPSVQLRDIMYVSKYKKNWDEKRQKEVTDTVFGFYNLYDWSASVSANTTLYGFYKPWRKLFGDKIDRVRHVLKPNVSLSYSPDFTADRYGYYDYYVKTDANGEVSQVKYSPYQGLLYGFPSSAQSGSVSFGLSNNLEMKVKSDRDTTGYRKVSLIDELSANMSYNLAAKTRPWSDLSMRIRLKLTKSYTFSLNANFATYAYEKDPVSGQVRVGDRTEWSYGRFGRFQGMSQNLSYTINNQKAMMLLDLLRGRGWDELLAKYTGKDEEKKRKNLYDEEDYDEEDEENLNGDDEDANVDPALRKGQKQKEQKRKGINADGYLEFSLPWSFTASYGVSMRENQQGKLNEKRMRYPYKFTQTLSFSGYVRVAEGWNVSFTSGYDFNYHDLSMTTMSLSRDLHCFEMTCSIVLKPYTSYNFSFRAKASELADALRYEKRSSRNSNIEWY